MMRYLKQFLVVLLMPLFFCGRPVYAGEVNSPSEEVSFFGHFMQKISKTALYIETIAEGVTYITSIGEDGNSFMGFLSSMAGNLGPFQDTLNFGDAGQFGSLLDGAFDTAGDILSGDIDWNNLGSTALGVTGQAGTLLIGSGHPIGIVAGFAVKIGSDVANHAIQGGDMSFGSLAGVVLVSGAEGAISGLAGGAGGGAAGAGGGLSGILGGAGGAGSGLSGLLGGSGGLGNLSSALGGSGGLGNLASALGGSGGLGNLASALGGSGGLGNLASALGGSGGLGNLSTALGGLTGSGLSGLNGLSSALSGSGLSGLSSLVNGGGLSSFANLNSLSGIAGASNLSSLLNSFGSGNVSGLANSLGGIDVSTLGRVLNNGDMSSLAGMLGGSNSSALAGIFGNALGQMDASSLSSVLGNTDINSLASALSSGDLSALQGVDINSLMSVMGNADISSYASQMMGSGTTAGSTDPLSSYARIAQITESYGAPQEDKATAQKYVKEAFFYSTHENDEIDGVLLTEQENARDKIIQNRKAYQQEVVSLALATAYENRTTAHEETTTRYGDLRSNVGSAKTINDKKGMEGAITQEETRQRITSLSLELALLELELVEDLQKEPENYIIARTAEQITDETKEKTSEIDFLDDAGSVGHAGILVDG